MGHFAPRDHMKAILGGGDPDASNARRVRVARVP